MREWPYVVRISASNDLKSFDEVPFEIHAIEDEAAYEAAKAAYLSAITDGDQRTESEPSNSE